MEVILPTGKEALGLGQRLHHRSSRSRCGVRCCRATRSSRCTAASSCRPTPTSGAREVVPAHGARHDVRAGPRLRPRVVAAGRGAVGASRGRRVGVGRRAAAAGHAVEAPARDGRRRRADSAHPARGAPDAGRWSICSGTGSTAASSSSGNERAARVARCRRRVGVAVRASLFATLRADTAPVAAARRSRRAPARRPTRRCSRRRATAWPATTTSSRRAARTSRSAPAGAASIMANSARDPYLHASVRRETIDHPSRAGRHRGRVRDLPRAGGAEDRAARRAGRRRSSRTCRRRAAGDPAARRRWRATACRARSAIRSPPTGSARARASTATSSWRRRAPTAAAARSARSTPDAGRRRIMHSVTGFEQEQAPHIRESELCATCHTLITEALGPDGRVIGSLPEQMNYQEWRHSAFFGEKRSCQSCHMPPAQGPVRVSSVLGDYRDTPVAPHVPRRQCVHASADEPLPRRARRRGDAGGARGHGARDDSSARDTTRRPWRSSGPSSRDGTLAFDVVVTNLTGHKFPTGYPSRRAWLHVTVRDRAGSRAVRVRPRDRRPGSIDGNDSDAAAATFEPHYEEITRPDEVQIYESIMGTPAGAPTTGLLQATQYLKDNRLLPRGFDKRTAARRDRRVRRRGDAMPTSPATAIACGTACRVDRPGAPSRSSCGISRSAIAGRRTWRPTTRPEPRRSSATTTSWRPFSSVVVLAGVARASCA